MIVKRVVGGALNIVLLAVLGACGGGGSNGDGGNNGSSSSSSGMSSSSSSSSSSSGGGSNNTSHNAGQNCMTSSCHGEGGDGQRFTVAGTIYSSGSSPQTNGLVRLYVHNTNTLLVSLTTDDSGNFYTSEEVSALVRQPGSAGVEGVDPEIEGPSGQISAMPGLITNGSCNGCHGNGNGVLRIN